MAKVIQGRYTAQTEDEFIVFWIGMRVNKLWAVHKWVPTFLAMGRMLRLLNSHPERGFLSGQAFFAWPTIGLLQYWRSFEDLEKFARQPSEPHIRAWRRFNRAVGVDGSVGIFHETYLIAPQQYEVIYNNMPVFGLAAATRHVKAAGKLETARRRLGGNNQPAVATPTDERQTQTEEVTGR